MHGEDQHTSGNLETADLSHRIKTAHHGHGDVENQNVRCDSAYRLHRFLTIRSFSRNLPFRTRSENSAQALTHNVVIVRNYNLHGHVLFLSSSLPEM